MSERSCEISEFYTTRYFFLNSDYSEENRILENIKVQRVKLKVASHSSYTHKYIGILLHFHLCSYTMSRVLRYYKT